MKRRFLLMCGVFVLLSFIIGMTSSCTKAPKEMELEGMVEGEIQSSYCEVQGKITEYPLELGQKVKMGEVLAKIDSSEEQYTLEQLQQTLVKKQAALSQLKRGAEVSEIKQCENNIVIAEQLYDTAVINHSNAADEYERTLNLYSQGAIAKVTLDDAKERMTMKQNDVNVALAQVDNAKQQLILIQSGSDQELIESAMSDISQTESQINQLLGELEKYTIYVPCDGILISKNYNKGDVVTSGYNLADISVDTAKYVVAYIPQDQIHLVEYGQKMVVIGQGEQWDGEINYIDLKAEYTPKNMQSSADKNKESFKIKVKIHGETSVKVGERVLIRIAK